MQRCVAFAVVVFAFVVVVVAVVVLFFLQCLCVSNLPTDVESYLFSVVDLPINGQQNYHSWTPDEV